MRDDLTGEVANAMLPLVDVVFLLLASILILARIGGVEAGIETPPLKEVRQDEVGQSDTERLEIRILGDQRYLLGFDSPEELNQKELLAMIQGDDKEIHLYFKRELPSFELVSVLSELKQSGDQEIRLHYDREIQGGATIR